MADGHIVPAFVLALVCVATWRLVCLQVLPSSVGILMHHAGIPEQDEASYEASSSAQAATAASQQDGENGPEEMSPEAHADVLMPNGNSIHTHLERPTASKEGEEDARAKSGTPPTASTKVSQSSGTEAGPHGGLLHEVPSNCDYYFISPY